MTREEIIEQLNLAIDLIKQDGKDWLDDRDIPMLEECVKALSQEPIKYWIDHNGHVIPIQQPSVTQKSGKWIAHSDGGIWIKYYECSECGRGHDTHSDYCPNCGAKMESEEQT